MVMHNKGAQSYSHASGNVLFLILIAVALFAALSYTVTQSQRVGATSVEKESSSLAVSQVLSYVTSFRTGFLRMTTTGLSVSGMKFANDIYLKKSGAYANGVMGSPADPSAYLFHPKGGGVVPLLFEDISTPCSACGANKPASGHVALSWLNIPGVGTSASDFTLQIWGVSEDFCLAFNADAGVNFIPAVTEAIAYHTDGMSAPVVAELAGLTPADTQAITGKPEICYKRDAPAPTYNFTAVIQAN